MPLSSQQVERRTSDPRVDAIEALILPLLQQQAEDLAERWTAQARSVLLLDGGKVYVDGPTDAVLGDAALMERHGLEVPWSLR